MVKILSKPYHTSRNTQRKAFLLACKLLDVNEEGGKERNDVRIKVGQLMEAKVLGRAFPIKKNKGPMVSSRNRPVPFDNPLRYCYPKKITTKKDKERYLEKSFERGEMTGIIYHELKEVLD